MKTTTEALRVISLGDLVCDLVVSIPHLPVEAHRHQLASKLSLEPGGAGNFLIAGARLGLEMRALGTLGDDSFGSAVAQALEDEGVNLDGVERTPGSTTTTVVVLVDDQGKHVFLGNYGEGPNLTMPDRWRAEISKAQALFSAGYTLQETRLARACEDALALANELHVPVFFDPGPEMERATESQRQLALHSSRVLLLTADEIPLLTGGQGGLEAARSLLAAGPQVVCVKRGAQGCVLFAGEETIEHPGFPVDVRDTAAAGDSFDAAFIYAWLHNWDLSSVAAFANAMGAAKVRKFGSGRQVPTAAEVQRVLNEFDVPIHIQFS